MSDIAELQERVQSAQQAFSRIDRQQSKVGECLFGLIGALEQKVKQKQAELDSVLSERQRLRDDNDRLRALLTELLETVEAGGEEPLGDLVQRLEARVAYLIAGAPDDRAIADLPDDQAGPDAVLEAPDLGFADHLADTQGDDAFEASLDDTQREPDADPGKPSLRAIIQRVNELAEDVAGFGGSAKLDGPGEVAAESDLDTEDPPHGEAAASG